MKIFRLLNLDVILSSLFQKRTDYFMSLHTSDLVCTEEFVHFVFCFFFRQA